MELVDIFNADPFRAVTLTANVNKRPFLPGFLESLGIFTPVPIRTVQFSVQITDEGTLKVIPTTPRGAPPYEQVIPAQQLRQFNTGRIAIGDTIQAHELQGILARNMFMPGGGMNVIYQDLQSEIAYRMDSPTGMRSKVSVTKERMRLGAIQGQVLDADGSVLYDWPTLLGMSLPAEIDFNLDAATPVAGVLSNLVRQTKRSMLRAAKVGNDVGGNRVIGLAGDAFFDALVNHADVLVSFNTFQANTAAALALSRMGSPNPNIEPFSVFPWGGIDWVNYRGTDDGTTVAIATDKVKFVPVVPGLFQEILSPGENFVEMNAPGQPVYAETIPDRDRNRHVRLEMSSYPAYVATRPDALFSGRLT
jgi:hypothetical protein